MGLEEFSQLMAPSTTLMSAVNKFLRLQKWPILDAGCGVGRNAVALALSGMSVVCADQDIERLRTLSTVAPRFIASIDSPRSAIGRLYPICTALDQINWPFSTNCLAAITCVHFLKIELFDSFWSALVVGGYLYIETFGGHGNNHLDLPKAGQLRSLLSDRFNFDLYHEKKVGPAGYDAVAVKLLAQKL